MERINIDEWADSICKYMKKYMHDVEYKQFIKDRDYKEYLKYIRQCDEEKNNLIHCINSIEHYNLLPHGVSNSND